MICEKCKGKLVEKDGKLVCTPLTGLTDLTELDLRNNPVSDEDLTWLMQQLPNID